jgi:hypothetical protein
VSYGRCRERERERERKSVEEGRRTMEEADRREGWGLSASELRTMHREREGERERGNLPEGRGLYGGEILEREKGAALEGK